MSKFAFMEKKILDTEYVYYELVGGIIMGTYKQGVEMNLKGAKEMVKSRLEISNGKSYPLLIDGRGLKSINKEARDYFASEEGRRGITAAALLAGSVFTTFLIEILLIFKLLQPF